MLSLTCLRRAAQCRFPVHVSYQSLLPDRNKEVTACAHRAKQRSLTSPSGFYFFKLPEASVTETLVLGEGRGDPPVSILTVFRQMGPQLRLQALRCLNQSVSGLQNPYSDSPVFWTSSHHSCYGYLKESSDSSCPEWQR